MIAYRTAFPLRFEVAATFQRIVNEEILPLLREQKGFEDALALTSQSGRNGMTLSLWHDQSALDAYLRLSHPIVLQHLETVIRGLPRGHSYVVTSTTRPPQANRSVRIHHLPASFLEGHHDQRP